MSYYPIINTTSSLSSGIVVEQFQQYLILAGYPVPITGEYDDITKSAVSMFVSDLNVAHSTSGGAVYIGPSVWTALISYVRASGRGGVNPASLTLPDITSTETGNELIEGAIGGGEKLMNTVSTDSIGDKKSSLIKIGLVIGVGYLILSSLLGKK
jgi:hypothetical protein